jgi:hypothetical protein
MQTELQKPPQLPWSRPSPAVLSGASVMGDAAFSAVGWYYARALSAEMGVPVGMVMATYLLRTVDIVHPHASIRAWLWIHIDMHLFSTHSRVTQFDAGAGTEGVGRIRPEGCAHRTQKIRPPPYLPTRLRRRRRASTRSWRHYLGRACVECCGIKGRAMKSSMPTQRA